MTSSKRLLSALVVAAASLTAMAGAQAQSTTSGPNFYAPGSGYIGFNAGKSDFSVGAGNGLFSSENKDTAYNIYGGTYFNPNFGLEAGFTDFGKIKRGGGTTKANGINLSLVGKLPLSESFNLLGKVGTTYGRTDVSSAVGSGIPNGKESGFGLSYGIGAEYFFTPAVSGVVQYDEHQMKFAGSDKERVGAATVGLRYRF
ncbi:MAG: outer membrane beta-barrel protein [Polaromonas sp.]|nr:outer membrane beta-barrel protein [Polaromonas sp.]